MEVLRQTCQTCRKANATAVRAEWGCDTRTREAQLWIPCVRCDGQSPDCKLCRGTGYESLHDCPWKLLEGDQDALQLYALHATYPAALPRAGGLYDQPARYLSAMRLIESARQRLEDAIRRDQAEEANRGRATQD